MNRIKLGNSIYDMIDKSISVTSAWSHVAYHVESISRLRIILLLQEPIEDAMAGLHHIADNSLFFVAEQ